MTDGAATPKPDYLTTLFSQTAPITVADSFVELMTRDAAITAANIPDLLPKINLGLLTEYIANGDTHRMFFKDLKVEHFFFSYECPNTHSVEDESKPPTGESGQFEDADVSEFDLDTEDPDLEGEGQDKDLVEVFGLDMATTAFSTGIDIAFNEDTGLYQVDGIFIKTDGEYFLVSCEREDAETLNRFTTAFSLLAIKIINGQSLDQNDLASMEEFCHHPPGQEPTRQPDQRSP